MKGLVKDKKLLVTASLSYKLICATTVCPECLQAKEPIVDFDHLIYQSKTLH